MRLYFTTLMSVLALSVGIAYAGSSETSLSSWGSPIPTAQLDTQRGGTDTGPLTINVNDLNAKLYDNSAYDNVTGHNSINGHAFAGASGLPIVMQNTGNNVIMQNAVILNLTMQ
jgi:hypothetical protein